MKKIYFLGVLVGILLTSQFALAQKTVEVLAPGDAKDWLAGNTYNILWQASILGADQVNVYLDRGTNEQLYLGSAASSIGKLAWTIPSSLAPLSFKNPVTDYNIRIVALNTATKEATTVATGRSGYFSIVSPVTTSISQPFSIVVISPGDGKELVAGSSYTINWQTQGTGASVVEAYLDRGTDEKLYIGSVPVSAGQFRWTIPSSLAPLSFKEPVTNYNVRLVALDTSTKEASIVTTDRSGFFSIVSTPTPANTNQVIVNQANAAPSTLTSSDKEALIAQLLKMLVDLQAQLAQLLAQKAGH